MQAGFAMGRPHPGHLHAVAELLGIKDGVRALENYNNYSVLRELDWPPFACPRPIISPQQNSPSRGGSPLNVENYLRA
jgi:hypothetical protein